MIFKSFNVIIYIIPSFVYLYSISYHILYIIAEDERKLIPTIKEVLTNRIIAYLKCRHV